MSKDKAKIAEPVLQVAIDPILRPISEVIADLEQAVADGREDLIPELAEMKRKFGEGEVWGMSFSVL